MERIVRQDPALKRVDITRLDHIAARWAQQHTMPHE
jgi:hypothetical protein